MSIKNQNHEEALSMVVGTPSGGGTQEDPPTGGSGGGEGEAAEVLCDFSVLHHEINKDEAPLFQNYPGTIHCYVPFQSVIKKPADVHDQEYKILKDQRQKYSGRTNPYLSEVVFFFKNRRPGFNIQPVRNDDRNRIFLGQAVWFKPDMMPTRDQPNVKIHTEHWGESGETKGIQFIIHEIRPVYQLKNWTCPEVKSHPKLDTTVEPLESTDRNYWLIVVRPRKKDLKHEKNKYGIGIIDTPKKSENGELAIPQLYQNVLVYGYDKSEKDNSEQIPIKNRKGDITRATIEVVPKIVLMPHPPKPSPDE